MTPDWPPGPSAGIPPRQELHVWAIDLDSGAADASVLSGFERRRAATFLRERVAARWVTARWGLREVLSRYLGEPAAAVELRVGEHGKPLLAREPERLAFNLSHSGALALVALGAAAEVGVDLERIEPRRDEVTLAARALRPADAAAVREAAASERTAVFFARWVEHEARLKCLGTGIGAAAQNARPVAIRPLDVGPGYAAAVAIAAAAVPPLRCYALA